MKIKRLFINLLLIIVISCFVIFSVNKCSVAADNKPVLDHSDLRGYALVDTEFFHKANYVSSFREVWSTKDKKDYDKIGKNSKKEKLPFASVIKIKRWFLPNEKLAEEYLSHYISSRGGLFREETKSGHCISGSYSGKIFGEKSYYVKSDIMMVFLKKSTITEIIIYGDSNDIDKSWEFAEKVASIIEIRIY